MRIRRYDLFTLLLVATLAGLIFYPATPIPKHDPFRASAAPRPTYNLSNLRVVDADTIEADVTIPYTTTRVDLPYNITLAPSQNLIILRKEHIRIQGVNAYERSTPRGLEASKALEELIPLASTILLQDTGGVGGRDKYGRILGEVILVFDPPGKLAKAHRYSGELRVSEWVLDNNYGVPYAP